LVDALPLLSPLHFGFVMLAMHWSRYCTTCIHNTIFEFCSKGQVHLYINLLECFLNLKVKTRKMGLSLNFEAKRKFGLSFCP
jgi:hypothetical protein